MKRIIPVLIFMFLFACAEAVAASVKSLSTDKIGEFVSPGDNEDDDSYPYRADPKGKYYHFQNFAMDGCSQFCGIEGYEEEFSATSTLAQIKSTTYGPENLRNMGEGGGSRDVVWCEGVKGYGVGERVNMSVTVKASYKDKEDVICFPALMIVNGHARNETTWKNNSRVKTLRFYVDGEPWRDLQLKDTIKPQIFNFGEGEKIYPAKSGKKIPLDADDEKRGISAYKTDFSFEIIEVYRGDKYDDTCITGIAFDIYTAPH